MTRKKKSIGVSAELDRDINRIDALVIGTSAGGLNALTHLLSRLHYNLQIPIVIVQHLHPQSDDAMARILDGHTKLKVKEAEEKEYLIGGTVYMAPANYHLLLEQDKSFSLTIDEKINFCRPAIDPLFETAAEIYRDRLIGLLMTGANSDGSSGLQKIKACGGLAIVEDPATAEVATMPETAIRTVKVDFILPLEEIPRKINELCYG